MNMHRLYVAEMLGWRQALNGICKFWDSSISSVPIKHDSYVQPSIAQHHT